MRGRVGEQRGLGSEGGKEREERTIVMGFKSEKHTSYFNLTFHYLRLHTLAFTYRSRVRRTVDTRAYYIQSKSTRCFYQFFTMPCNVLSSPHSHLLTNCTSFSETIVIGAGIRVGITGGGS